ncbi:Expansin-like [Arachis hypogaea]|nr:Expansin-like [Arachis hypogaea]
MTYYYLAMNDTTHFQEVNPSTLSRTHPHCKEPLSSLPSSPPLSPLAFTTSSLHRELPTQPPSSHRLRRKPSKSQLPPAPVAVAQSSHWRQLCSTLPPEPLSLSPPALHSSLSSTNPRVACNYPHENITFKIDESSSNPNYLEFVIWYQQGIRDITAVQLCETENFEYKLLDRSHGAVWSSTCGIDGID